MNAPGNGGSPQGAPFFALDFVETSILYSILYERSKCLPSREEMLDEIQRKELYPTTRHVIPKAMDKIDSVQDAMREYLVCFAGEAAVVELENRVDKTLEKLRGD